MAETETREDYVRFSNAVAGAVIDYAAATGLPYPLFSDRYRAADVAWRELHPGSAFGTEFGDWPDQDPAPEIVPEPVTPTIGGLARCPGTRTSG